MGQLHRRQRDLAKIDLGGEGVDNGLVVAEIICQQCFTQHPERELDLASTQIGNGWDLRDRDLLLGQSLDVGEQALLARLGQGDRRALPARSSDAPDAVNIRLRRRRHVVVDDVGELIDVEATGGDIGGHE